MSQSSIPHSRQYGLCPPVSELETCFTNLTETIPSFSYGSGAFTFLGYHVNQSPPRMVVKSHRHSYTEIILILAGEANETSAHGGKLTAGMIQVHGPGTLHSWQGTGRSLLRIGLYLAVQPFVPVARPPTWPIHSEMLSYLQELIAETATRTPGHRERLLARLILLLAPALGLFALPESPSLPNLGTLPAIRNTSAYVEQFLSDNLREPLTLQDVAAQLSISVPTLTRHFRQATGCSVMERLQELRMKRAAELLQQGTLSVKQIAVAVGIPEPSYFCRCFRRVFGCTPLQLSGRSNDSKFVP